VQAIANAATTCTTTGHAFGCAAATSAATAFARATSEAYAEAFALAVDDCTCASVDSHAFTYGAARFFEELIVAAEAKANAEVCAEGACLWLLLCTSRTRTLDSHAL
jgi:hypothetical protein